MAIPEYLRRLRERVGHDLVLLPAASAVVVDDAGRVLLHLRSDTQTWALPGGIVEPGEQPADAVVREVAEETGVDVVVDGLVGAWTGAEVTYPNGDVAQYVVTVYRCRQVGGAPRADGDESLDVAWFHPGALPALPANQRQRIAAAIDTAPRATVAGVAPAADDEGGPFTVAEARAELARLRPVLDEIVAVRADAAELAVALGETGAAPHPLGGLAELKAAQARLDELLTQVQETGAELKGFAPLLVDFPARLDGVPVLLCWLEGEAELAWYHRLEVGFAGRRRLPR